MRAIILGGHRYGEWLDLVDGSTSYVDLRTAETYLIRRITWAVADQLGQPAGLYKLPIAVWPGLTQNGPALEQQNAYNALVSLAMTEYMQAHAEGHEVNLPPDETVPDTPADLFGADGKPIVGKG